MYPLSPEILSEWPLLSLIKRIFSSTYTLTIYYTFSYTIKAFLFNWQCVLYFVKHLNLSNSDLFRGDKEKHINIVNTNRGKLYLSKMPLMAQC